MNLFISPMANLAVGAEISANTALSTVSLPIPACCAPALLYSVGASAVVLRVAALACGAAFLTAGAILAGAAFVAVAFALFRLGLAALLGKYAWSRHDDDVRDAGRPTSRAIQQGACACRCGPPMRRWSRS